ncbi:Diaminohydroxyphosphoribosylaminopyrimidine deaminase / 5-amino-6-(5-phosphoribosylamino)uracil reductase [hydrothermal vent metagenome]|uniref:Diaminohydroxyphosphoribosylaminopyrimidine deaminase / 5-amino-6-(5-phosphoribosylamino)uracil reductase n=1 Tax=hydrothermal vent metagenome TaxID=652676 RepID=A0A3B0YAI1_9ZZZZ
MTARPMPEASPAEVAQFDAADHAFMAEAVQLARRGIYSTHPNPNVGSLIVANGEVLGRGWHQRCGEPHAEVFALREAGEATRGATAYVTLEPCSHSGRTPPCADALVKAGVVRVVIGMQDPNPQVAGRGVDRLREAGINVETGLLEAQVRDLNPGFISRMERGRPWLRVKLAASLDGRTAMASGESQWISGPEARQDVQRLRARSSAVMTGIGTVVSDDPSLNVRLESSDLYGVEPVRQPLRVMLDSHLRLSPQARMLSLPGETLIMTVTDDVTTRTALEQAGATVCVVETQNGKPAPRAVLQALAEREMNEVLLECGPTLAGAFMAAGLIDELVIYLAPHLMGDNARGLFNLPELEAMQDRIPLQWQDVRQVGDTLRVTLRPAQS